MGKTCTKDGCGVTEQSTEVQNMAGNSELLNANWWNVWKESSPLVQNYLFQHLSSNLSAAFKTPCSDDGRILYFI